MGDCVHFKDGKYRLWSSICDEFATEWIDEKAITKILLWDDTENHVQERLKRARENGCSLIPVLIRHTGNEL